jgi:hypothetical protein
MINSTWTGPEALASSAYGGYCGSGRTTAACRRTSSEIRKTGSFTSSLLKVASVLVGVTGAGFSGTFMGGVDGMPGGCVAAGLFSTGAA